MPAPVSAPPVSAPVSAFPVFADPVSLFPVSSALVPGFTATARIRPNSARRETAKGEPAVLSQGQGRPRRFSEDTYASEHTGRDSRDSNAVTDRGAKHPNTAAHTAAVASTAADIQPRVLPADGSTDEPTTAAVIRKHSSPPANTSQAVAENAPLQPTRTGLEGIVSPHCSPLVAMQRAYTQFAGGFAGEGFASPPSGGGGEFAASQAGGAGSWNVGTPTRTPSSHAGGVSTWRPPPLDTLAPLGIGAAGYVSLVRDARTRRVYALKVIGKALLVTATNAARKVTRVRRERDALMALAGHPCIVELKGVWSDACSVCLLTEPLLGGDLHSLLGECGALTDAAASFYTATVALALGAIHAIGAIYRDVKAENVGIDSQGWARLIDLGGVLWQAHPTGSRGGSRGGRNTSSLDKSGKSCQAGDENGSRGKGEESERTTTRFGTVEYMSPEMVAGGRHGLEPGPATDWWSLGALLFELLVGRTPCALRADDTDSFQIARRIRDGAVVWPRGDEPPLSADAEDLLKQLLEIDEFKRLGSPARGGEFGVLSHPFLTTVDPDALLNRCGMEPPYRPSLSGPTDTARFAFINGESYAQRRGGIRPLSELEAGWERQFDDF
mmetsp:Transcript_123/g.359  ORF Transcript_123/g.359 Transcript_123/m.359 type:complete len:613 (+) Transcript_123:338-2176(+)